jgi:hypothetical protein
MPQHLQLLRDSLHTAGQRLRARDLDLLSRWTAQPARQLAPPGIEQYAELLAANSAAQIVQCAPTHSGAASFSAIAKTSRRKEPST